MNRVIDHLNEHLAEAQPLARLARLAGFSSFHFHRLFRAFVGEPVHAYLRRIRLERAVYQLAHGPRTTLTEIALRCGFAASSDFSRAFKQAYGFSPRHYSRAALLQESKIRQDLLPNRGYGLPRLGTGPSPGRFKVRFVTRPEQRIAYVRVIGGYQAEKILAGFERLMEWKKRQARSDLGELIGMSQDDPEITPADKYRFDWCLGIPAGVSGGGGVSVGRIPANRFACIHIDGDIHEEYRAWSYLFHDWLPRSGHQPTNHPAMEVYRSNPADSQWTSFDLDCCLPVIPLPGGKR